MKSSSYLVFATVLTLLSCSSKKDREIALQKTTIEVTDTRDNTIKSATAKELESQFKGCKAHW